MFNFIDIREQIEDYEGEWASDFDNDIVMDELYRINPEAQSVDDFDDDEFQVALDMGARR